MTYAVVTGDIVESSRFSGAQRDMLNESLRRAFEEIKRFSTAKRRLPAFNIFRGDSFQGLFDKPEEALKAAIFIRAALRHNQPGEVENDWDARIAVGTGTVDYLPDNITEGDGEAYQNSGPVLDDLKGHFRAAIKTPNEEHNKEFRAQCALLDAVIAKWTPNQAEVVGMLIKGMTPKEISTELNISQPAIHYRMKGAGWFAVEALLERNKQMIKKNNE